MKAWFKAVFFVVTMGSLIAVIFLFHRTLEYAFNSFDKFDTLNDITLEAVLSVIAVIVPAISSLIVAFIKIPEIIAQYLFNTKEDDNMNSIIKNIQDYDKAIFSIEQRIDELLMEHKDQGVEDEHIEESPNEKAG